MASNNPQVLFRLPPDEYEYLKGMAERHFVTLPQFVRILARKAMAEDKQKEKEKASSDRLT